jgi:hypothetical protein
MCVKVSHTTKKRAEKAAYAIKAKGKIPARAALHPYYCKKCQAWHLSRMDALQYLNKISKYESKKSQRIAEQHS